MYNAHDRTTARMKSAKDGERDLHSQLEDLLHAVWMAERDWTLLDRVDLSLKLGPIGRR